MERLRASAASVRQGSTRAFAHGTSLSSARGTVASGLDEATARALSRGGRMAQPGKFHTYELGPPSRPGPGIQDAFDMGLRHDPQPVVLIGRVPKTVMADLEAQGLVRVSPVPGTMPQTVFEPGAYPALNASTRWQILDPFNRP